MNNKVILLKAIRFKLMAIVFLITSDLFILPSYAHPFLSIDSKVGVNNIGSIRIGMTKEEAEAVSGVKLLPHSEQKSLNEYCYYLYPDNDLGSEVGFMMEKNRIMRVDIKNEQITTISGAKIGDTESQIKSIYPGKIKVMPGKYAGNYLIYEPTDIAYKEYLLLFESVENKVVNFRVGYKQEVGLVEGCS